MGNSTGLCEQAVGIAVHPHVHGELVLRVLLNDDEVGSSPRAWGTHLGTHYKCAFARFIPTCMGNSF